MTDTMTEESPVTTVYSDADSEAPFGRFKNGNPRKRPPKGVDAPRKTRQQKSRAKPDYRDGIRGFAQIAAFAVNFFSPLDAVAITDHSENIANAAQITADNDPRFAAALDKILTVGPYGALLSASIGLFAQIGNNHDIIPDAVVVNMGGRPKSQLLREMGVSDEVREDRAA